MMRRWLLFLTTCCAWATASPKPDLDDLARRYTKRTEGGVHLPLVRTVTARNADGLAKRAGETAAIGLGDYFDVTYNVIINVGSQAVPLILDTGSSDLWVISDACTGDCNTDLQLYPQSTFKSTGLDVRLLYGDSFTGTHAFGLIGTDKVNLAGLELDNQLFAAINDTNTSVLDTGSLGIFGTGFPINSVIWAETFSNSTTASSSSSGSGSARRSWSSRALNLARRTFPDLKNLMRPSFPKIPGFSSKKRQSSSTDSSALTSAIVQSWPSTGPLLPRLSESGGLASPMYTVTLQRDTIEKGGNVGLLSVGELPSGVNNDSLTWVPLRTYSESDGGLSGPSESPNEQYPIPWEVFIDDVYFDGEKLPRSTLASSDIELSALVDTGNSLIRGPSDTLRLLQSKLGGSKTFPCSTAHTLAFQIAGKMFPVDPRDFVSQAFEDNTEDCVWNLAVTDTPVRGEGYLYSWSLGDPFLKSVLSAYYFGNISYPSQDPPRMGFLSTVPEDASAQYSAVVASATGNFFATTETAPSATGVPASAATGANGVPEAASGSTDATGGGSNNGNGALGAKAGWAGVVIAMAVGSWLLV